MKPRTSIIKVLKSEEEQDLSAPNVGKSEGQEGDIRDRYLVINYRGDTEFSRFLHPTITLAKESVEKWKNDKTFYRTMDFDD